MSAGCASMRATPARLVGATQVATPPLYTSRSRAGFLTHWGRVTHICVGKLTIIGSDNGLSPGRRQAIIWINAGILLIGPLGTNFSVIYIEILTFSFKKMRLKMSSGKWRPFCLGLNVLKGHIRIQQRALSRTKGLKAISILVSGKS